MAEMPPGTGDNVAATPAGDRPPARPRWVKVFGIIVAVLVLLFVILLLTGGPGRHGPGRHMDPGGGHTPPAGGHAP